MKNRKSFLFNEAEEALNILTNGFEDGKINYSKMYIVAKYMRETFGYGRVNLEKEIINFCKTQDANFNPIVENEQIKKWIKSALNYNLRVIDSVFVTKNEIEFLKKVELTTDRKILYTILILSKALKKRNTKDKKSIPIKTSENYYIKYSNFTDVIRLSKISKLSEIQLAKILHKHKEKFKFYSPEKELIRLEYAETESKDMYEVKNLSNISESYKIFFENIKDISICDTCHKEFEKINNRQQRCNTCSIEVKKERKRKRMQNIRKQQNFVGR